MWRRKVVPGQLFCRNCKAKFLLATDSLYWWSKLSSICYRKGSEFTDVTKENAPFNWHFVCHFTWIYENFKEQYFKSIQSTSWLLENLESDSYDKNDMKQKVNDLVRLYKAMQEKFKTRSYSEQIQILTLVPDKWSWMYWSEYFNVFEYPVWTLDEIKNVGELLIKPVPKKGKTITNETLHLVTNIYEDDNFSR